MLKPTMISSSPRTQAALARVERLADLLGISKCQAAVLLVMAAPEPLAFLPDGGKR